VFEVCGFARYGSLVGGVEGSFAAEAGCEVGDCAASFLGVAGEDVDSEGAVDGDFLFEVDNVGVREAGYG
jgi:hypothetical protein